MMRHIVSVLFGPCLAACGLVACGAGKPAHVAATPSVAEPATPSDGAAAPTSSSAPESIDAPEKADESSSDDNSGERTFALRDSETAGAAHGVTASKIEPSASEAAMKFFVIDKDKGPISGIVISLTAPDGKKYYTEETDAAGYAEVLVPVGQNYDLVYLSLGRRDIAARVPVSDEPNQNIKLTLRYKGPPEKAPSFVLKGVQFDTAKATIRPESFPNLDAVVEYMKYKKSARILISGHTDNVGSAAANKQLSERRAEACRNYLISKGIDGNRIEAVGYGDERPIAPNDTEEGRQKNRRIEASEL